MWRPAFACLLGFLILSYLSLPQIAEAHPMGNFSINHYARIAIGEDQVALRYIIDMAEIPTVAEKNVVDADGNGQITDAEKDAYLRTKAPQLRDGLNLTVDGKLLLLPLQAQSLEFRPGAGGLETLRLTLTLTAPLPVSQQGRSCEIAYQDTNYSARTGWKEIVAVADTGLSLLRSSASSQDISKELTDYPTDPNIVPPQQMEAKLVVGKREKGKGRSGEGVRRWALGVKDSTLTSNPSPLVAAIEKRAESRYALMDAGSALPLRVTPSAMTARRVCGGQRCSPRSPAWKARGMYIPSPLSRS